MKEKIDWSDKSTLKRNQKAVNDLHSKWYKVCEDNMQLKKENEELKEKLEYAENYPNTQNTTEQIKRMLMAKDKGLKEFEKENKELKQRNNYLSNAFDDIKSILEKDKQKIQELRKKIKFYNNWTTPELILEIDEIFGKEEK